MKKFLAQTLFIFILTITIAWFVERVIKQIWVYKIAFPEYFSNTNYFSKFDLMEAEDNYFKGRGAQIKTSNKFLTFLLLQKITKSKVVGRFFHALLSMGRINLPFPLSYLKNLIR